VNLDKLLRELIETYPNLLPSHAQIQVESTCLLCWATRLV
jgi:hypothetical protein